MRAARVLHLLATARAARIALRVAYDGTHFRGWQRQPGARTVEGVLRDVLSRRFAGADVPLLGASRTDAGVHASGQAAHADVPELPADFAAFEHQVNRMLPEDARVFDVRAAPPPTRVGGRARPWHAIACATGKRYVYRLTARRGSPDPLDRLYRGHVAYEAVDPARLAEAAGLFVGTRDFAAFANNAPGQDPRGRDTVRTVSRAAVVDEGRGDFSLALELDGALYKMVRNLVGCAVAYGTGRLSRGELDFLLSGEAGRRDNPADAAPARGLCLERVFYGDF